VRGHELKIKPALLRRPAMLALFLGAALVCFALPAAAQTQPTISVSPNPVAVGQQITVTYDSKGSGCIAEGATMTDDPTFHVGASPFSITMNNNQDGTWTGTYKVNSGDVGNDTVSVSDTCSGQVGPINLTVVQLNGLYGSGATQIPNDNNDVAALQDKGNPNDVVTVKASLTPDTDFAATLLNWSGSGNGWFTIGWLYNDLWACIGGYATKGCPAEVPFWVTIDAVNWDYCDVWVFWASIKVNTSGWDGDDPLTFNNSNFTFPYSPGQVDGPLAANVQILGNSNPNCFANAGYWSVTVTKVEIVGTFSPKGVGNVLGNSMNVSFNNQQMYKNTWDEGFYPQAQEWTCDQPSASQYKDDIPCGGSSSFFPGTQQWVPTKDKIFAIDAPGNQMQTSGFSPSTARYYCGYASAFEDKVYVNGTTPASDIAYWHSFIATCFMKNLPTMSYSVSQDPAPITVPTTFYNPNDNTSYEIWGTPQDTPVPFY
jgi:hypothetical protein